MLERKPRLFVNAIFEILFALCIAIFLQIPNATAAEPVRLALVIGNGAYESASQLKNPKNDAELIASVLRTAGAKVTILNDLNLSRFKIAVSDFASQVALHGSDAEVFVFYAGHGVQFDGRNFLVPIDAKLQRRADIPVSAIELSAIVDSLGTAGAKSTVIILDACRNNPFRGLFRGAQGLKVEGAPPGVLISFSTAPHSVAADGAGNNSPFSAALAKRLRTPGQQIETVLKRVRHDVWKDTNGSQIPWENTSLFADLILFPTAAAPVAAPFLEKGQPKPQTVTFVIGSDRNRTQLIAGTSDRSFFRDCAECPKMAVIPSGIFLMGSDDIENASPAHEVILPRPFAMSSTEVSFADYAKCGDCSHKPSDEGWGQGQKPVVNVNWTDAVVYTEWLSKRSGYKYRLPTEAEWEYAASAGTDTKFWQGSALQDTQANLDFGIGSSTRQTVTVTSLLSNPWGLHHVHGNVAEWVQDCWNKNYADKPARISANASSWDRSGCYARVVRGGGWATPADSTSLTHREWRTSSKRTFDLGFRVVREIVD